MKFYATATIILLLIAAAGFAGHLAGYRQGYADGFESKWSVSLEQFEEAIEIARKLERERRAAGTFEGRQ